jgi:hypothetical protein
LRTSRLTFDARTSALQTAIKNSHHAGSGAFAVRYGVAAVEAALSQHPFVTTNLRLLVLNARMAIEAAAESEIKDSIRGFTLMLKLREDAGSGSDQLLAWSDISCWYSVQLISI